MASKNENDSDKKAPPIPEVQPTPAEIAASNASGDAIPDVLPHVATGDIPVIGLTDLPQVSMASRVYSIRRGQECYVNEDHADELAAQGHVQIVKSRPSKK